MEDTTNAPLLEHYYGDTVRKIFLAAGILLLIATIRDNTFLPLYLIIGTFAALALTILAGLTNPQTNNPHTRKVIAADLIISIVLFVLFEYMAIAAYSGKHNINDEIFLIRQALAILFLTATYYSTKTSRSVFL